MAGSKKSNDTNNAIPLILIAAGIVLIIIVLIWQLFMAQSNPAQSDAIQPTVTTEIPYPEIARASLSPHIVPSKISRLFLSMCGPWTISHKATLPVQSIFL